MGLLKNALKKSFNNALKQTAQKYQPKNTNTRNQSAPIQNHITREKQQIASDMRVLAKEQADQYLKIVYDCVHLVNTTTNPDVFFSRYALMLDKLEQLAGLECTGIFANSAELPSVAYIRVDEQFPTATNDFLDRSFEDAKKRADNLKTETGRNNAINRFFDKMETYIIHMSGESIEYFDKMKETNKKII